MMPLLTSLLSTLGAGEAASALSGSPLGSLMSGGNGAGTKAAQQAAAAAGGDASPMIQGPAPQTQMSGADLQRIIQMIQSGRLGT